MTGAEKFRGIPGYSTLPIRLSCESTLVKPEETLAMQQPLSDAHDVLLVTKALIYFVFVGTGAVAIAVLAHLVPSGG